MHGTTLFAPIWPKSANLSAREPIAAFLRAIARLLHLARANNRSQNSSSQREQLELKIASLLSEANSAQVSCFEETSAGLRRLMSRFYRSGRLCREAPEADRDQKKRGKNNKRYRQGDAGLCIDDGRALGSNAKSRLDNLASGNCRFSSCRNH